MEAVANIESKIAKKKVEVSQLADHVEERAKNIRHARNTVIPKLKSMLQENLYALGMPSASFKIEVNPSETFKPNGKDDLVFLFSANKGSEYGELKLVAFVGSTAKIFILF